VSDEWSGNVAKWAQNGASGSTAVNGHPRNALSGSGAWSGRPWSGEQVSQK